MAVCGVVIEAFALQRVGVPVRRLRTFALNAWLGCTQRSVIVEFNVDRCLANGSPRNWAIHDLLALAPSFPIEANLAGPCDAILLAGRRSRVATHGTDLMTKQPTSFQQAKVLSLPTISREGGRPVRFDRLADIAFACATILKRDELCP